MTTLDSLDTLSDDVQARSTADLQSLLPVDAVARPRLVCAWYVDTVTGRPVCAWHLADHDDAR